MRRGLALIVVLGILGVLAVLAVSFVTVARLERRASQQRLHATKALLLARSGIEDALARLAAGQNPEAEASRYRGEDWNPDGILNAGPETEGQAYQPGRLDTDACPVEHAMRPSFFRALGLNPRLVEVEGRRRGYSGLLAGDLGAEGNTYALKISSGGIYVNGGDVEAFFTSGYNVLLTQILQNLAEAIDREDGVNDGQPVDLLDGMQLMTSRPEGRAWASFEEIRDLALGGSQAKLEALRPYLTLNAWVDRKVIVPNAGGIADGTPFQNWGAIKTAHGGPPGFEAFGRAPVDLAWARHHRPVLIALLAGLKGLYLDETTALSWSGGDRVGTLRKAEIQNAWAATDDCHLAADALFACTSDLATWGDWDAFCDGLPFTGTSDQIQAKRDILKANFNPNSDLNKTNPDRTLARLVDKSDLLVDGYSTEWNLSPRGGGRVVSLGRVLSASGHLLAQRQVTADLEPDRMVRLTTQKEFVAGNLGDPSIAGDESGFRAYGDPAFISLASGADPAFGHRFLPPRGIALQTGPEPHTVATPADWDGQLRLATLEADAPAAGMTFLAAWDNSLDADFGASLACVPDVQQAPATRSVWDPAAPGTLLPDGIYSEEGRQPGYASLGNMAPSRGSLSFWVKPNYRVCEEWEGIANRTENERRRSYLNNTRVALGGTAAFWVGNVNNDPGDMSRENPMDTAAWYPNGYGMIWERAFDAPPPASEGGSYEQNISTAWREPQSHRWVLLTSFWDMEIGVPDGQSGLGLWVNAGTSALDAAAPATLYSTGAPAPVPPLDLTAPDLDGPAHFYLGRHLGSYSMLRDSMVQCYGAPDATFDELAIYDFNPDPALAAQSTQVLAQNRYKTGRYYKESTFAGLAAPGNTAAEYFSAPIALGPVWISRLAWTQVVPRALKAPLPAGGTAGMDGDPGKDGRILLELANAAGNGYLTDDQGRAVNAGFTRAGGEALGRLVSSPFRLHAVFQPFLEDIDTPILEPLALDDVTVVYRPRISPRVLGWDQP